MKLARLISLAEETVAAARKKLPPAVREAAASVPISFESRPNQARLDDDWEPDLLGLFVGPAHGSELSDPDPLPPQILLFVDNLWDYAEADEEIYRDEVRLTFLHELGHFLGWDEDEVARRGLD